MLGFPILSRAWFGIIFVPLSLLYLYYFYMLVTIVTAISIFILFMFFVIMFMVYFDYMFSIVGLSFCSCISAYSAQSKDPWVGGRHCVSMVDHGCDTPIESFVVYSPNIGARRVRLRRKCKLCS